MEYEIVRTKKSEKTGMTINLLIPKRTPEEQKIRDKEIEEGLVNLWISIKQREQREQAMNNVN